MSEAENLTTETTPEAPKDEFDTILEEATKSSEQKPLEQEATQERTSEETPGGEPQSSETPPTEEDKEWPKKAVNVVNKLRKQRDFRTQQSNEFRAKVEELEKQLEESRALQLNPDDHETFMEFMEAKQAKGMKELKQEQQLEAAREQLKTAQDEILQTRQQEYAINLATALRSNPEFRQLLEQNKEATANLPPAVEALLMQIPDPASAVYTLVKEGTLGQLGQMTKDFAIQVILDAQRRGAEVLRAAAQSKPAVSQAPAPRTVPEGASRGGPASKPISKLSADELYKELGIG